MICKQCGKKVNGKTGICSHCGTKKSKKWLFILIPIGVLLCICIAIFSTAEFNKEMSKAADYISAKDFENAKSILDSQLGTNGSQPKVYLIFSDYYLAQEEYMQAVDILEEGLRECSSDESIQEKLDKIKAE